MRFSSTVASLDLFSGIGAWPEAMQPLELNCVGYCRCSTGVDDTSVIMHQTERRMLYDEFGRSASQQFFLRGSQQKECRVPAVNKSLDLIRTQRSSSVNRKRSFRDRRIKYLSELNAAAFFVDVITNWKAAKNQKIGLFHSSSFLVREKNKPHVLVWFCYQSFIFQMFCK